MKLYLVQHGLAMSKEDDPNRPLSLEGRADVTRVAALLKGAGVSVALIGHSGKPRAEETASILGAALAPKGKRDKVAGLAPLDPVAPWAAALAEAEEDTLLAGHQPFMGQLVSYLLTGSEAAEIVTYEPGTVCCLERHEAGRWRLNWMLRPGLLG